MFDMKEPFKSDPKDIARGAYLSGRSDAKRGRLNGPPLGADKGYKAEYRRGFEEARGE